jgi:hypothetical protein
MISSMRVIPDFDFIFLIVLTSLEYGTEA